MPKPPLAKPPSHSESFAFVELDGPMPDFVGGMIYEISLPSGYIVTSPKGFGFDRDDQRPIIADNGALIAFG